MTTFRRGHAYWVRMPGESKRRPAIILSNDIRNERSPTVIVVPCTTAQPQRLGPWHVALRKGEAGLPSASVAKCEDVTLLEHRFLIPGALGGSLSAERLQEIRDALVDALDFE